MVFAIRDWIFDIDVENTRKYTDSILPDHCECGYCRNFYRTVDSSYPDLRAFLNQFGVDPEVPVDFLPVEPTLCIVSYAVSGRILKRGSELLGAESCPISVQTQEELDYELQCQKPYFVFTTDYLELPWVLEEDMNEVISPANEPACLERMWKKLLANAEGSVITS